MNFFFNDKNWDEYEIVHWNDPDDGICSGEYKILDYDPYTDLVSLVSKDGSSFVEAYTDEVSKILN